MILNNKYDTSKPILETLFNETDDNGQLSDNTFSSILFEYGIKEKDEDMIMEQMMASEEYEFKRYGEGWNVEKITN